MTELREKLLATGIFEENQYFDKYCEIVGVEHTKTNSPTQKHHIIPRSYYKFFNLKVDNSKNNLINLSYREHILAHYYLALCVVNKELKSLLSFAFQSMTQEFVSLVDEQVFIESLSKREAIYQEWQKRNSELAKERFAGHCVADVTRDKISQKNKGKYVGWKHMYKDDKEIIVPPDLVENMIEIGYQLGRCLKTREGLSKGGKGRICPGHPQTDIVKKVIGQKLFGVPKTEIAKSNMSIARKGKRLISNDATRESFYINEDEATSYIENGFHFGRLS